MKLLEKQNSHQNYCLMNLQHKNKYFQFILVSNVPWCISELFLKAPDPNLPNDWTEMLLATS